MCFYRPFFILQYHLHAKYVAGILREAASKLKRLPNLNQASTAISKQVTICGDLHGKLDDLLVVFHKVRANKYEFNIHIKKHKHFNLFHYCKGDCNLHTLSFLFQFILFDHAIQKTHVHRTDYRPQKIPTFSMVILWIVAKKD